MYEDYKLCCEEDIKKSYSYIKFWRTIKDMHISFAKLGLEECEVCDAFKLHKAEFLKEQRKRIKKATKITKHQLEMTLIYRTK